MRTALKLAALDFGRISSKRVNRRVSNVSGVSIGALEYLGVQRAQNAYYKTC